MNRRALLLSAALLPLAACGPQGAAGGVTPAQVIADARGIVRGIQGALGPLAAAVPGLISPAVAAQVSDWMGLAAKALDTITAQQSPDQTAPVIQQVEGYVNQALAALAAVTPDLAQRIPAVAPYVVTVQAVIALMPALEAFANTVLTPTRAAAARASLASPMTEAQARVALGVPAVADR